MRYPPHPHFSEEPKPSKPTLKDVVDGTPVGQAAVERAMTASAAAQAKMQSSKLDNLLDDYQIREGRAPLWGITTIERFKARLKALIESEVIGPDGIPSNEDPYAVGQNLLRKVQRLRKDNL